MSLSNEDPPLCASCKASPAVKAYTIAGETEMVCARCSDIWSAHEALDAEIVHIIELGQAGRFDEAIALLDAILEANRHLDHDRSLAGSVALQRGDILFKAGRYAEAENTYNEWTRVGFVDLWRQQLHALGLAQTLEAQGRDREAVAVLENVLGNQDRDDLPLALTILTHVVRLSDKLGLPVDSKWLTIAEGAADLYEVDMPVRDSPGETILALKELTRGKQPTKLIAERMASS